MSSIPIHYKSIEEIQNSYINKTESPLSVTNHFLERIQNIDKDFQSYATVMFDEAISSAEALSEQFEMCLVIVSIDCARPVARFNQECAMPSSALAAAWCSERSFSRSTHHRDMLLSRERVALTCVSCCVCPDSSSKRRRRIPCVLT